MSKKCFKCGLEKELDFFYVHNQMKDGHLNKCIDCTKKDVDIREKRLMLNPEYVESEKKRHREKAKRLHHTWKQNTPEKLYEINIAYKLKYPEKYKARNASQHIITSYEKHHWSYNEEHYKDIIELDKSTHMKLHRYLIYDQERCMYRCSVNASKFTQLELLDTKERHLEYLELIKNKH